MAEFKMPSLGADMESGVLVEWTVKVGDAVERGDVVAVVETDKGAIDVEIFQDGVIEALLVEPDTRVPVGATLARLRVEGEQEPPVATEPKGGTTESAAPSAVPSATGRGGASSGPGGASSAGAPAGRAAEVATSARPTAAARVVASPRARKLAAERGVALEEVEGTGPQGSITAEDIERAAASMAASATGVRRAAVVLESTGAAAGSDATGEATRGKAAGEAVDARPTGMRAAIAAAMSRSKREIPHYYLSHTIDLEPALRWLEARNATVPITERVLPVALLVRAVARALRTFPELCGFWRDGGFQPSPGIHVGLAVALRDGGLVNPAIHDADQGSLAELFGRIRDVTQRARTGQLRSSEFSDAAITITSLGDQGVDAVFGVIHPPQVAIVGFGTITARPWVVEGHVEARRVVTLSLSADHRVSDGHRGGRFVRVVEQHLQEPQQP